MGDVKERTKGKICVTKKGRIFREVSHLGKGGSGGVRGLAEDWRKNFSTETKK